MWENNVAYYCGNTIYIIVKQYILFLKVHYISRTSFHVDAIVGQLDLLGRYMQGLSQDLETGCPKLPN